MGIRSVTPAGA